MEVRYVGAGSSLDEDQVEERGLDKFSLRACIQPESAMGPLLWLAVFPLGKEDLVEKRPQDYWTRKCPQIHFRIGLKEAGVQRNWRIEIAVVDGRRDQCGFGIFPGLENLGF